MQDRQTDLDLEVLLLYIVTARSLRYTAVRITKAPCEAK